VKSTLSRRAFVTALGMLSVPLITFAQEKKDDKDREEKKKEAEKKAQEKKEGAKDKAEDAWTTGTRSSILPGPITARTGGRIDGAMEASDESFPPAAAVSRSHPFLRGH
jgi:hypothetical protein